MPNKHCSAALKCYTVNHLPTLDVRCGTLGDERPQGLECTLYGCKSLYQSLEMTSISRLAMCKSTSSSKDLSRKESESPNYAVLDAHLSHQNWEGNSKLAFTIREVIMAKTSSVEGDTFRELSKIPGVLDEGTITLLVQVSSHPQRLFAVYKASIAPSPRPMRLEACSFTQSEL